MTMHICHPSLSLNGKKKGKKKFRNSEAAARARQQAAEWENLKTKWGAVETKGKKTAAPAKAYVPSLPPGFKQREQNKTIRAEAWDPCTKNPDKVYTGDKIIGIGTMHKSNAVPIFSDQDAKDISSMRR